jgi:hypothetical protein
MQTNWPRSILSPFVLFWAFLLLYRHAELADGYNVGSYTTENLAPVGSFETNGTGSVQFDASSSSYVFTYNNTPNFISYVIPMQAPELQTGR